MTATATATKKPGLNLGKLSAVAQIAVQPKPTQPADAEIELSRIFSVKQVRTKFGNLEELAESFKLNGIIEPLVVHEEADGRYRIIVGERRFRAAPLAGLSKAPVVIKRGMSELEIRRMQVSENNDREDLSAYDQAMGVIEDVERYGIEEASRIWNKTDKKNPGKEKQSEGWISKRMAVTRYAEPVLGLLKDGLCEDFEVLHSLNQLHAESEEEFRHMLRRLHEGLPLSRDEARNKVSAVKQFKREQAEFQKRREEVQQAKQQEAKQAKTKPAAPAATEQDADDADRAAAPQASTGKAKTKGEEPIKPGQTFLPTLSPSPEEVAAAERAQTEKALANLRKDVFEWGETNLAHFNSMKAKMAELDCDMNQTEWVQWSGFLSMVLPMMVALGENKSLAYLKKLQDEFKTKTPLLMWREQHPLAPEADPEHDDGPRIEIPPMPEGWRF
ncbi:MAG: ParB/RepB/Spo0J family partition protein [Ralstonia sp.]|nr:MAG: ParB/RepB/Spo0J family partition protein [Ralstonia sp.]